MKKTQIGWIIIVATIFAVGIAYFQKASPSIMLQIGMGMFVMVVLFGALTVHVTDEFVKFSFGIGLFHGKYWFENIEYCKSINYMPLGYGIRFRPGVTIFNVSGYKAIEIKRKDKKQKIWIGTSFPDEFVSFINSRR